MSSLRLLLRKIFPKASLKATEDVERLRLDFKERYHHFKLLLNANNQALEVMAELEQALHGQNPFGMTFIRSACTSVSVNVHRMILAMENIAPGKYTVLMERFNVIQSSVENLLAQKKTAPDPRLVIPLNAISKGMADLVGGKMANLAEIRSQLHMPVPEGFVLTATAHQRFFEHNDLQTEINRRIQAAETDRLENLYSLSAEIQQLIIHSEIPDDLQRETRSAWRHLEMQFGRKITMALRSSAIGEDVAGASFAGQYRSELNVSFENVFQAYKEVVASKYSLPAMTYRLNRGFRDEDISMCVGCLMMIDAQAGGVIYSRNPVNVRDSAIMINAAWGLPKTVVDGSDACDLFVLSRDDPPRILREEIKPKQRQFKCYPEEGVCRMDLTGAARDLPAIDHATAICLAQIAVQLESLYGHPQDIEWAIDQDGAIYMLQCRGLPLLDAICDGVLSGQAAANQPGVIVAGGVTASAGAACGPVFFAEKGVDILAFPKGSVLVVRQALPRWAPLLNRAAAIVAEQGGFAGHLANVAREFGVPALFGLSGAASSLKSGSMVTVDADGRAVHQGCIETLTQEKNSRKNLMAGSPVYNTLQAVCRCIVPLHLLDPASTEFQPQHCRTLHDITRFIHEKSVYEMFDFGKDHHFAERSSKQLFYKVPMQWWVLNLDDGFRQEIDGKYIHLEDIVSVPMRALWRGFTAIAWEGPPVDGRGLMSVMFRATQNQSLNTGVRSRYAERNYFMISRNFCNFTSRLGFHFSTLEALVSERTQENYITYQFKGGAADLDRRLKRVHFISAILEDLDFTTELREDHLSARLHSHKMAYMLKRLEILGYLTLHTRQLDMIMANPGQVAYYQKKIGADIASVMSTCAHPDDLELTICPNRR
jgi:pyruvate,water dikinase